MPARVQPRLRTDASLVSITVIYTGFTPQAQAAFQHAVDLWADQITSPVPIRIDAQFTALGPGVLGSADRTLVRNATGLPPSTWYPIALANKIAGVDPQPAANDIRASFSNSFSWHYGTDGNAPAGTYDFVSVVMHELGHGLGFIGSASVSAGSGSWGAGGNPFVYDTFTENGGGQGDHLARQPVSGARHAADEQQSLLRWPEHAARQRRQSRPHLRARELAGSSYSHFDESTFPAGNPNSLMTPQIASREAIHDPGPVGRGLRGHRVDGGSGDAHRACESAHRPLATYPPILRIVSANAR